jgi:hypothetical protein
MPLAPRFLSRQMLCLLLASPWQWVAAQAPSDGLAARTGRRLAPAATPRLQPGRRVGPCTTENPLLITMRA